MARTFYIAAPEPLTGKPMVTVGLAAYLAERGQRVAVLRPLVEDRETDPVLKTFTSGLVEVHTAQAALTYREYLADPAAAIETVMRLHRSLAEEAEVILVSGTDYESRVRFEEFEFNCALAANLGALMIVALSAYQRTPEQVADAGKVALATIRSEHAQLAGFVVTRVEGDPAQFQQKVEKVPTYLLPEEPLLTAPRVLDIAQSTGAELISGDESLLEREAEHLLVCGMNAAHVLERLKHGQVVIAAADRPELLVTVAAAHAAPGSPSLAGLILNGGFETPSQVMSLISGLVPDLPIMTVDTGTFETATAASAARGPIRLTTARKVERAKEMSAAAIPSSALDALTSHGPLAVMTPLMFQADLVEKAAARPMRIVLPEPDDDRILQATDIVVRAGIAKIILLGDEATVRARAQELGVDLGDSQIVSPTDPQYLEKYATEFARLRAKKGVTIEQAREKVQDVSYFGTMMVHMGDADGMVSGAAHTTAHTIVPSFQIIKTKPGTSIVSSVFLMLMKDRVHVFGDCAVNLDPSAQELADIAVSSAETARQFGVEPRVAMISYSTGTSGSGPDVDKVREATELVRANAPDLAVDGPLQFDASVDAAVAAKKMPGSPVAGKATVFIFPDLNTGNTTYKAVQRSSGAVAVGPILQGLNKPVNDLSRGALVEDIVNTVAITAIQAQALVSE